MFVEYIQLTKEVKFYISSQSNLPECLINTVKGAGLPFFPHPEHSQCKFHSRRDSGCPELGSMLMRIWASVTCCAVCLRVFVLFWVFVSFKTRPLLVRLANNSWGGAAEASTHQTLVPASSTVIEQLIL